MTLVEFLLARLAEDEEDAADWTHRARPELEVAAKRAIVDEHHSVDPCDAHDGVTLETVTCDTLRHLAGVYADHSDYDEAWRP